ncbi:hypothetical protein [Natronospira bacteriovora]|uniref:Uncharacterized protein n=1 Tax=Natronospira bacteriovora TaxID=3069753 RepID=A0ABU0W5A5_9GAMM|nr:hypothetical protein [Natronospira sp. AB-CW4]MDQ2069200.1 hypothetical protein [Natronospira sp. AB-CW4]
MEMQKILKKMFGGNGLTVAEAQSLKDQSRRRLAEIDNRLETLTRKERPHTVRYGTPEALLKLDQEAQRLKAESEQVRARQSEVRLALREAEGVEAVAGAKEFKRGIADAVAAAESLERQAAAAREEVCQKITKLSQLRRKAAEINQPVSKLDLPLDLARRAAVIAKRDRVDQVRLVRSLAPSSRKVTPPSEQKGEIIREET